MTVSELREKLKGLDGNLIVMVDDYEDGMYPASEVTVNPYGTEPDKVLIA